MVHQLGHIDRAEPGRPVVARACVVAGHARHGVGALDDVVKDGGAAAVGLVVGKPIEDRVHQPLRLTDLLQNQGHDAGEHRGRGRGPAHAHELIVSVDLVRVLDGRGHRHVGNVPLAVGRNPQAELPGGFAVDRAHPAAAGEQATRALVPDHLGNVAKRRRLRGRVVGRAPVQGAAGGIVELGAADRCIEGRGPKTVDPKAAGSHRGVHLVAAGRAAVHRSHKHRHALCRCLLPQTIEHLIARASNRLFAKTVAHGHNGRDIVTYSVLGREVDPIAGQGGRGDNELDGRLLRQGARPLDIKIRFGLVPAADDARVLAVEDDLRIIGRQSEFRSEGAHVRQVDVAAPNDRDALSGSVQ